MVPRSALSAGALLIASLMTLTAVITLVVGGAENMHVAQAWSFLHGQLTIDGQHDDTALFEGRSYDPFPPFPAIVLVPLVALLGRRLTKTIVLCLLLTVINAVLLDRVLRRLDTDPAVVSWLSAAFFAGTAYWFCLRYSDSVWYYAHIVAVTCLLGALYEATGRGRGYIVGLLLGGALLSRQLTCYATIFLGALLWQQPRHRDCRGRLACLAAAAAAVGLCVVGYMAYNRARFGSALDTGYSHIVLSGFLQDRFARYGLFHPVYVPFNLCYLLLQGFHVEFSPPFLLHGPRMDPFGTSLTFASPFLFFALRCRWRRALLWPAWLSVLLPLLHSLFYYNNGLQQFNAQRFPLDYMPILILLVAGGARAGGRLLLQAAIIYSIALNVLALVLVPLLAVAAPG